MEENKVPVHFVYAGARRMSNGKMYHQYYILDDLSKNKEGLEIGELREWSVYDEMWKKKNPGMVMPANLTQEGKGVSYNQKALPVAMWHSHADLVQWKALDIGAKKQNQELKEMGKDELIQALRPIRDAMRQSGIDGRRTIMAEVMRIINS